MSAPVAKVGMDGKIEDASKRAAPEDISRRSGAEEEVEKGEAAALTSNNKASSSTSDSAFDDGCIKYICICICCIPVLLAAIYGVAYIFSDECTNDTPIKDFTWFPPSFECLQCQERDDCLQFTAEGEAPMTCDTRTNTCASIPSEGYPVWLPSDQGSTYKKIDMPRNVVEDGPVTELVYYFDLNEQPTITKDNVTFNGTHITLPLHKQMLAGYSKVNHVYNESETGVVTLAFLPNTFSVVTDKPQAGMIEKFHALTYSGNWSEVRSERNREINNQRKSLEQAWDDDKQSQFYETADYLALAWSNRGIISSQVESGLDKAHLLQMREHVKKTQLGQVVENVTVDSPGWAGHREKAMAAIQLAKDSSYVPQYKKSENHCKHMEQDMGISYDESSNTVTIPVGSQIVTLSGEMLFAPTYFLTFGGGLFTVDYNPNTGILQIYFRGYQVSRQYTDPDIPIEDWPYENGLWVSPVSPAMPVQEQDGRSVKYLSFDAPTDNRLDGLLGINYEIDYSIFGRPISETCNARAMERIDGDWKNVRLSDSNLEGFERVMNKLDTTITLLQVANAGVLCGGYFMRSDYARDTNGYEINEQGVWIHLLLEVDQGHTEEIASAQWWDHWDCFYKNKDLQECT